MFCRNFCASVVPLMPKGLWKRIVFFEYIFYSFCKLKIVYDIHTVYTLRYDLNVSNNHHTTLLSYTLRSHAWALSWREPKAKSLYFCLFFRNKTIYYMSVRLLLERGKSPKICRLFRDSSDSSSTFFVASEDLGGMFEIHSPTTRLIFLKWKLARAH